MSKPPGSGICVHCLKDVSYRDWDHVLPVSWYPDSTPTDLEKWKIPTCRDCNKNYGKIERDLLVAIGLCLNSDDPEISSVQEKALRSVDPEAAKNRKDRRAREKLREKVFKSIEYTKGFPEQSIFPNFGPKGSTGEQLAITIRHDHLGRMAEKIVRGIIYKEKQILLNHRYKIQVYYLEDDSANSIVEIVRKHGGELNRGPGFSIVRATVDEDPASGIYAITIWKQLKFYVIVNPRSI